MLAVVGEGPIVDGNLMQMVVVDILELRDTTKPLSIMSQWRMNMQKRSLVYRHTTKDYQQFLVVLMVVAGLAYLLQDERNRRCRALITGDEEHLYMVVLEMDMAEILRHTLIRT